MVSRHGENRKIMMVYSPITYGSENRQVDAKAHIEFNENNYQGDRERLEGYKESSMV